MDRKTIDSWLHVHKNQWEIKFLHLKKAKWNELLYTKHLECAATWTNYWHTIDKIINSNLQDEMESHYEKLNRRLDRLLMKQKGHTTHTTKGKQRKFHPRTVNLTNIHFT